MAGIRNECNRIAEARDLCIRALEIREIMLDHDHSLLGNTYYSMGIVYMEDEQVEKSPKYNHKAVHFRDQ
jgi:hypothetical protein